MKIARVAIVVAALMLVTSCSSGGSEITPTAADLPADISQDEVDAVDVLLKDNVETNCPLYNAESRSTLISGFADAAANEHGGTASDWAAVVDGIVAKYC
ncbi:MAG: hypothetical protein QG597_973 [Actinomycetota bacterium]|jgi:hypothetical protein|nr:hypothetical protein [Actinomycetota bacterium]